MAMSARGNYLINSLINITDLTIEVSSKIIAVITLVVMFLSLMAEVIVRYVTNQGMGWPTEIPSLLFPWLMMSGIVLAAQYGKHIAVETIRAFLGKNLNRVLLMSLQVVIICTFFYLAQVGLFVIEITGSEVYPVTKVSAKWAYLSIIVGFVALGLTGITTFFRLLFADDPLSVRAPAPEDSV
jgi:TRAP-type C4-dicarboxylate transport system permease small subunit